jgi:hypothetical protein
MLHFQLFIHETKPWAIDHAPLEDVTLTQDTKVRRIMGRLERYPVEAVVLEAGSALARAEEALSFIAVTDAAGFIYQPLISLGRIIIAPRLKPLPEAWGMHILAYHAAGKVVSFVLGAFESMTIRDIFDHNRRASILPARLDDLLRAYIRRDDGELRRAA